MKVNSIAVTLLAFVCRYGFLQQAGNIAIWTIGECFPELNRNATTCFSHAR